MRNCPAYRSSAAKRRQPSVRAAGTIFPFLAERIIRENRQCSSCDLEHPPYATTPDHEFEQQDACPWIMGEFVWTGFDYLGEPSPYNSHWPVRSSYYGIFDLAGLPKDRAYLYKARWSEEPVLHLLPHWNWPGREESPPCRFTSTRITTGSSSS